MPRRCRASRAREPAEEASDRQQHAIGQARDEPDQPEADPRRPPLRTRAGGRNGGAHPRHPRRCKAFSEARARANCVVAILRGLFRIEIDACCTGFSTPSSVSADAAGPVSARGARHQVSRLFRPLARALRILSRSRHPRQHLDPRGFARRGQRGGAADRGADAPPSAFAVRDHDGDADGFGARAAALRRSRVPRLSAVRPDDRRAALSRPHQAAARGDHGNRDLAEPLHDLRRSRYRDRLANARLSEKSLRGYWPIQPLARRAIRCASFIAAQSASDNERLHALGAPTERLAFVGNLKFDMNVPADVVDLGREFRAGAGADRRSGSPRARTKARRWSC